MNPRHSHPQHEELRNAKRAPIEFSAEIVERGFRPSLKCRATVVDPSQTGMGLRSALPVPEGTRLKLFITVDTVPHARPLRLRGTVVWSARMEECAEFASGIELDARSKDLKSWQSLILTRLRNLEA